MTSLSLGQMHLSESPPNPLFTLCGVLSCRSLHFLSDTVTIVLSVCTLCPKKSRLESAVQYRIFRCVRLCFARRPIDQRTKFSWNHFPTRKHHRRHQAHQAARHTSTSLPHPWCHIKAAMFVAPNSHNQSDITWTKPPSPNLTSESYIILHSLTQGLHPSTCKATVSVRRQQGWSGLSFVPRHGILGTLFLWMSFPDVKPTATAPPTWERCKV